jgi:4-carboxymuconolactone decarboxylase
MAISETARRNHDELFPGHVSTLKVTDPELIEVFDNFAFDEVLRHAALDTRTRLMVQLAALIGCQALSEYRVMLGAALTAGVTPVEAREIVYQAVPYAGMGKAFDFIHATNDVLTERGVALPLDGQATTTPATRAEQGRAVQEEIVGANRVAGRYAAAAEDQLHFQRFLSANCFGDHVARARAQPAAARTAHLLHPGRPGRVRPPGQGARSGQPQRRQRPAAADQRDHSTPAVHRLFPRAQRARGRQRGRARSHARRMTSQPASARNHNPED